MPSLTTQSIGALGGPLANSPHAVQLSRSSQAGVQAGLQQENNAVRATHSATKLQQGVQRSIQAEARPEGAFEEGSEDRDEPLDDSPLSKQGAPRINKIA